MMEFEQHPTEPDTLVIKMPKRYIAKQWVGLTDEELVELRETHQAHIFQLMFAVEAKLKEKNT